MLKAIIVEDEQNSQALLKQILEEYCEDVSVVGMAEGVGEAVSKISEHKPDLVLLDIELSDGDGFQVLEQLKEIDFDVIFITAYNQYAVKAFKFSAIDYILKPVDIEELQAAVKRVQEKQELPKSEASNEHFQALIANLRNTQQPFKRIVLPTSNGFTVVDPKNIIRCESDRNYTFIYLEDGRRVLVSRTIKEYEEMLKDYNFFRVHQSHIINLNYLKNYIRGRGGQVELTNGTIVDVSARRKTDFLRRLSAAD